MRHYITPREFDRVLAVATDHPRDALLLLLAFRHGLRVSEALALRWRDLDLEERAIFIQRVKRGVDGTHPLGDDECVRIQAWRDAQGAWQWNDPVFTGRSGKPLTRQYVHRIIRRYGEKAGLPIALHPHCLRHACGYALANQGHDTRLIQDYLGHRAISSTTIYTVTNRERFVALWDRPNVPKNAGLRFSEGPDDLERVPHF